MFDDFDAADANGTMPTVIVVQADVYDTAEGAAGAASDCDEFLDTMWEFVTEMGFEFYEPEFVEGSQVGDESCLYSAEEDVGSSDSAPLKLTFVGFRQDNALVIVGVFSLTRQLRLPDAGRPGDRAKQSPRRRAGAVNRRPADA